MEVVLIRWPAEAERRRQSLERGVPRLLLIEEGFAPPAPGDCLEDWIRIPAEDNDVRARMASIAARAGEHSGRVPLLDDDGVLRFGDRWVALPPVEVKLTQALLERFNAVARRDDLTNAAWPEDPPARNVLDVHVLRLRRRLLDVGLTITTVRSRGYVLKASEERQRAARHA